MSSRSSSAARTTATTPRRSASPRPSLLDRQCAGQIGRAASRRDAVARCALSCWCGSALPAGQRDARPCRRDGGGGGASARRAWPSCGPRSPRPMTRRCRPRQGRRSRCLGSGDRAHRRSRLRTIDTTLMQQHKANPSQGRRLAAIPGIGPITALNLALRVDATQFASARHFSAWLGLVPRECSTAGKQRMGGISRAGDERLLRQLLVLGATAVIQHAKARPARHLAVAAQPGRSQAAQACRRGLGQQDGPHRMGHDDERGRPTGSGRPPPGPGSPTCRVQG